MRAERGTWSPLVFAGVALIATCYGFARFAYGLFVPEFSAAFSMSASLSGLIGSGSYAGYCVAIVAATLATARFGARPVAVAAGVLATAGIATVAAAPNATVLAIGVLVAGSSTGVASPPLAAAVAQAVRERSRDAAQTIVNSGTGAGVLVSDPLAMLLLGQWRVAWLHSRSSRRSSPCGPGAPCPRGVPTRLGIGRSWALCMLALALAGAGLALAAAVPALAILCGAIFGAAYIALTGVLLVWATRLHPGRAATGVGLVFLALAVGQGVGAPLVGWVGESVPLASVFVACAAVTAVGAVLGPRSHDRAIEP